jgi:uncharacterized protein YkwD
VSTFPLKRAAIAAFVCLAALAAPAVAGATCPDADANPAVIGTARVETATHCLINETRAQQRIKLIGLGLSSAGLQALSGNPFLYNPAVAHSASMAQAGLQAHTVPGESPPDQRLAGYGNFMLQWAWGENITSGPAMTPRQAVYGLHNATINITGWLESTLHRANMLSTDFRELGVGVRVASNGVVYYTADFAWGVRK